MIEPNPWSTIWFRPKETIRRIVDTNPNYQLLLLMILGGIGQTLSNARGMGEMFPVSTLILICILSGPLSGFLSLYISGFLLHWACKKFGGTATREQVRAVIAWSWAPIVYTLPLWGVKYILFRDELFTLKKTFIESQNLLAVLYEFFNFIDFAIVILYLFILFAGLSEVNRIPVLRSIGAVFMVSIIIALPILLLLMLMAPAGLQM
ncbi:YIP1 family protein [candidate division KSB1 bacterium]|nr:YIP1 family protein [candidate division KSB1 bacterium]